MRRHTESGPPLSGKTTRLVALANRLATSGKRVRFENVELRPEYLRKRYKLDRRVEVVTVKLNPARPVVEQEAVVEG